MRNNKWAYSQNTRKNINVRHRRRRCEMKMNPLMRRHTRECSFVRMKCIHRFSFFPIFVTHSLGVRSPITTYSRMLRAQIMFEYCIVLKLIRWYILHVAWCTTESASSLTFDWEITCGFVSRISGIFRPVLSLGLGLPRSHPLCKLWHLDTHQNYQLLARQMCPNQRYCWSLTIHL